MTPRAPSNSKCNTPFQNWRFSMKEDRKYEHLSYEERSTNDSPAIQ